MLTFDRIVLTMLALGIWALVLSPREIGAHDDNGHSCEISGMAYGHALGGIVEVYDVSGLDVECAHY